LLQEDAGWLFGSDAFLFNELFRVGGNRRLRGFDEEFFRVDGFAIQTIEIRFLLDRSSYFSAFYDLAYLERRGFDNSFTDIAHGFGLGFNFKTPIGLFNLSYALGGSRRTPLDLNAGKIHFGFVNVF
jgi:outer membrane protein assembly factor BamA